MKGSMILSALGAALSPLGRQPTGLVGDSMDYGAIAAPDRTVMRKTRGGIYAPVDFAVPMDRKDDTTVSTKEIKSFEDLKTEFLTHHRKLTEFIESANGQLKDTGKVSKEMTDAMNSVSRTLNELGVRLDKAEGKMNRFGEGGLEIAKSVGERFTGSAEYKALGNARSVKVDLGRILDTKAIVNATGQNQPLVPQMQLPGIVATPDRLLTIRDVMPVGRTASNLVQYAKENVFTNAAGPQVGGSPTVAGENQLKNESDITFTLANAPVVTIAHFILVSRQVLDDAPMLEDYINQRLMYGLKLEEEDEILNGDGQVGTLDGLMHQATGFNRSAAGTKIDVLRRSITQLYVSEFRPEIIILNPIDWEDIELTKDSQGRYILANPFDLAGPRLWGQRVLVTNSMTQGQFLTANLSLATQLWDRQSATVELSREDSDNFRRNMVTILAELREALAVYRPQALIKGTFS